MMIPAVVELSTRWIKKRPAHPTHVKVYPSLTKSVTMCKVTLFVWTFSVFFSSLHTTSVGLLSFTYELFDQLFDRRTTKNIILYIYTFKLWMSVSWRYFYYLLFSFHYFLQKMLIQTDGCYSLWMLNRRMTRYYLCIHDQK